MKKTLLLLSISSLLACTRLLIPNQSDADRAAKQFPGITLADITKGKTLHEQHCGKCHGLKNPSSRNEGAWKKILPEMANKAKIDAETQEAILKYILSMHNAKR